jgi:hypothetical protein
MTKKWARHNPNFQSFCACQFPKLKFWKTSGTPGQVWVYILFFLWQTWRHDYWQIQTAWYNN